MSWSAYITRLSRRRQSHIDTDGAASFCRVEIDRPTPSATQPAQWHPFQLLNRPSYNVFKLFCIAAFILQPFLQEIAHRRRMAFDLRVSFRKLLQPLLTVIVSFRSENREANVFY